METGPDNKEPFLGGGEQTASFLAGEKFQSANSLSQMCEPAIDPAECQGYLTPSSTILFEGPLPIAGLCVDEEQQAIILANGPVVSGKAPALVFSAEKPEEIMQSFDIPLSGISSTPDGRFAVLDSWGDGEVVTLKFGGHGCEVPGRFFKARERNGTTLKYLHCADEKHLLAIKKYSIGGGPFACARSDLLVLDPANGNEIFSFSADKLNSALGPNRMTVDFSPEIRAAISRNGIIFLGVSRPVSEWYGPGGIVAIQNGHLLDAGGHQESSYGNVMSFGPQGRSFAAAQDDDYRDIFEYPNSPNARYYVPSDTIRIFRREADSLMFLKSCEIKKTKADFMTLAFNHDETLLAGTAISRPERGAQGEHRLLIWNVEGQKAELLLDAPLAASWFVDQLRFMEDGSLLLARHRSGLSGEAAVLSAIDRVSFS